MPSNYHMKLDCDNKITISVAHNPIYHDRTKHVEVDKDFVKQRVEVRVIYMTYVLTKQQVADVLTKGFRDSFEGMVDKLGMIHQLERECCESLVICFLICSLFFCTDC